MSDHSDDPATSSTTLRISVYETGSAVVVTVAGEVDLATAAQLESAASRGLEQAGKHLCVIDLTSVGFLGSPGLSALVRAAKQAENRQEPLRIVVDSNRPVIRPIEISGLDQVLSLYHTVEEALRPQGKQDGP
ncbi:STAS domain-containing protein [Amycolatopsis pigmentata]|uniref:Anti-sigma factor antagonist n=1 Tax=Amycolatopsis pigmentata TaxID=450801 RepID=A0ABW5G0D9_9PSEU